MKMCLKAEGGWAGWSTKVGVTWMFERRNLAHLQIRLLIYSAGLQPACRPAAAAAA